VSKHKSERAVPVTALMRLTGLSAKQLEKGMQEAEALGFIKREKTPLGYTVVLTDPKTGQPIHLPKAN
jgi:hypothetical protein